MFTAMEANERFRKTRKYNNRNPVHIADCGKVYFISNGCPGDISDDGMYAFDKQTGVISEELNFLDYINLMNARRDSGISESWDFE